MGAEQALRALAVPSTNGDLPLSPHNKEWQLDLPWRRNFD